MVNQLNAFLLCFILYATYLDLLEAFHKLPSRKYSLKRMKKKKKCKIIFILTHNYSNNNFSKKRSRKWHSLLIMKNLL